MFRSSPSRLVARAVHAGAKHSPRAPILVDSTMLVAGIIRDRCRRRTPSLHAERSPNHGVGGTVRHYPIARRSNCGDPFSTAAVVAIGNAPTALFHLLEMLAAGGAATAIVLGFPVGFVSGRGSQGCVIDAGGLLHRARRKARRQRTCRRPR